jgi:integrase
MGGISKVVDSRGNIKYRASIHRKGCKPINKRFTFEKDAKRWIRENESALETTGLPITRDHLRKHTVREIVTRYLNEKTPKKGCAANEATVLKKFLRRDICNLPLSAITVQNAYKYKHDREKETWNGKPISPSTIRRELNTIQHVFEVARKEWGFTNLFPFRGIDIKGSMIRRTRRLKTGELDALYLHAHDCRGANAVYVSCAIALAVETGMRLQEIFNLEWSDVGIGTKTFDERRIVIRKSKTGAPRTIVMTVGARAFIMTLMTFNGLQGGPKDTKIFPMTKGAFKQSWAGLKDRAFKAGCDLSDLTFHDLRHEAGSRFDELELTKAENDLMMGHVSKDMAFLYINPTLDRIQAKLDASHYARTRNAKFRKTMGLVPREDDVDDDTVLPPSDNPGVVYLKRKLAQLRKANEPQGQTLEGS